MIITDDTSKAVVNSASPKLQIVFAVFALTRLTPCTVTAVEPSVDPRGGWTATTSAGTWYSNSCLLSLKIPMMSVTSTVVTPG